MKYVKITGNNELQYVTRILETQTDFFWSNSKQKLPTSIIKDEFDIDKFYFDNDLVYHAALLKRKIQTLFQKEYKFVNFILSSNEFDLFYYLDDKDLQALKTWLYQEQIHKTISIFHS